MKKALFAVFLVGILAACTPAGTPIPTATFTIVPPTSSPTMEPTPVPATPMPTQPVILMITPDPIQVERWREYQTALAKSLLSHLPPEEVICEWEILGRIDQEVYVWAVCEGDGSNGSMPAVIYLEANGAIQKVVITSNIPESYSDAIRKLFPSAVREKFDIYNHGRSSEMSGHLEWRRMHPEEPPLIILLATPIQ